MSNLVDWTLNTIRTEEPMMSWMEERRFDWVPLLNDFMQKIAAGTTVVVVVDEQLSWLDRYICQSLNKEAKNRPYIPIASLNFMGTDISGGNLEIIMDMLNISYKNDFVFMYIGKAKGQRFKLTKKKEDSFMIVLDEEIQNSFFMRSKDELLDIKFLHLVRLLDKTIDGVLFGEIALDG